VNTTTSNFLVARLFPSVVFAAAPAVTIGKASFLLRTVGVLQKENVYLYIGSTPYPSLALDAGELRIVRG